MIGNIPAAQRLGIANVTVPDATDFAVNVLLMPSQIPIYQQQLYHSRAYAMGPGKAAGEICGPEDSDKDKTNIIREVSPHSTIFARANMTAWQTFQAGRTDQIFYFSNEPEAGSTLTTTSGCTFDPNNPALDCWYPLRAILDPLVSSDFNSRPFWENALDPQIGLGSCTLPGNSSYSRVTPEALAYTYFKGGKQLFKHK